MNKAKHRGWILFIVMGMVIPLQGQLLEVKPADLPPWSPERLISDVFLGAGVEVLDVKFEGDPAAIGVFQHGQRTIGIDEGIVMTTGRADRIAPPIASNYNGYKNASKDSTDEDLDIIGDTDDILTLVDVARYEIMFRPTSSKISFEYVFGSNEYPEFICGQFNDVFGFFVRGPNPSGGNYDGVNIAKIPNTDLPVSVNTVHNGNPFKPECMPINSQYFNQNLYPDEFEYNAFLDIFKAQIDVVPCAVYTIKLAIADLADGQYDSGVFLKARSFNAEEVRLTIETPSINSIIREDCAPAQLIFTLPEILPEDYEVLIDFAGSASRDLDFRLSDSLIIIPAGQMSTVIDLYADNDGFVEELEEIIIQIINDDCVYTAGKLYIEDNIPQSIFDYPDTVLCKGEALSYRSLDPGTNQSTEFALDESITIPDLEIIEIPLNVSDIPYYILRRGVIESICLDIDHTRSKELSLFVESPSGRLLELSSFNGEGNAYRNTCFTADATVIIGSDPFLDSYSGSFLPEGDWNGLFGNGCEMINGIWKLIIYDSVPGNTGVLNDVKIRIVNPSKNQFDWTASDGYECLDCRDVILEPMANTTYYVTKSNELGCNVTDSFFVEVFDNEVLKDIQHVVYADSVLFTWYSGHSSNQYQVRINGGSWLPPNYTDQGYVVRNTTQGDSLHFALAFLNRCITDTIYKSILIEPCDIGTYEVVGIDPECFGDNIGQIKLSAQSEIHFWYNGEIVEGDLIENLGAGSHLIIAQNDLGCAEHHVIDLSVPEPLLIQSSIVQDIQCFGANNGVVNIEIKNQRGPISALWSDGSESVSREDLSGGTYTVSISDSVGCSVQDTVSMNNPPPLESQTSFIASACGLPGQAKASVQAKGGVGTFSYIWSNGMNTPDIENISDGKYYVSITDDIRCLVVDSILVKSKAPLELDAIVERVSCPEMNNGIALAEVTGGTLPYAYRWSHGFRESRAEKLSPGIYRVSVTDADGCETNAELTISEGADIFNVAQAINPGCDGDGRGSIDLDLNPVFTPYSVLWTSNSYYDTDGYGITNLIPGKYSVFIEDGNGCQYTRSFRIDSLNPLLVEYAFMPITCPGNSDGNIIIEPVSSNGTVQYSLNEGAYQESPLFLNLTSGEYTINVVDEADCALTLDSIYLEEPPELTVNIGKDTILRRGQGLEIIPVINLPNVDLQYKWIGSFGAPELCANCETQELTAETTFELRLIVQDGATCIAEDAILVTVNNEFTIQVPTGFSPNGDLQNDLLVVHGSNDVQIESFQVFDRNYNLLFEQGSFYTNDLSQGWDGFFKGQPYTGEVVIWKVIATLDGEITETFTGVTKILK